MVIELRTGARRRHHHQPPRGPQRGQRRRGRGHRGGHRPARGRRRGLGRHPHRAPDGEGLHLLRRRRPQGDQRGDAGGMQTERGRLRRLRPAASAPSRSSPRSTARPSPAAPRSCSPATSSWPPTPPSFGIPEVKRNLVAGAGGLFRLPRRSPATSPWSASSPASRSRPSGPTTSAWSTPVRARARRSSERHGAGRADRRERAAGRAGEPQDRARAADQPDEVGWKDVGRGHGEDVRHRGLQRGPRRPSSRSARRSGRAASPPSHAAASGDDASITPWSCRNSASPSTSRWPATSSSGTQRGLGRVVARPPASASSSTVTSKSRITKWCVVARCARPSRRTRRTRPRARSPPRSSRTTASASVSPGSTRPPGHASTPRAGPVAPPHEQQLPSSTTTAPTHTSGRPVARGHRPSGAVHDDGPGGEAEALEEVLGRAVARAGRRASTPEHPVLLAPREHADPSSPRRPPPRGPGLDVELRDAPSRLPSRRTSMRAAA